MGAHLSLVGDKTLWTQKHDTLSFGKRFNVMIRLAIRCESPYKTSVKVG